MAKILRWITTPTDTPTEIPWFISLKRMSWMSGISTIAREGELAMYLPLLQQTIAHVRQEISAGKSEKEIADEGLTEIWKPWFAPAAVPVDRDFMHQIYAALTHTSSLDQ